jgi:hypothetical protein
MTLLKQESLMSNYIDMLTKEQKDTLPENVIRMWVYSYKRAHDERDHIMLEISDYFGGLLNYHARNIIENEKLRQQSEDLLKEIEEFGEEFE